MYNSNLIELLENGFLVVVENDGFIIGQGRKMAGKNWAKHVKSNK